MGELAGYGRVVLLPQDSQALAASGNILTV